MNNVCDRLKINIEKMRLIFTPPGNPMFLYLDYARDLGRNATIETPSPAVEYRKPRLKRAFVEERRG